MLLPRAASSCLMEFLPYGRRTSVREVVHVPSVKMIAEYREHALQFERLANETDDVALKKQMLKQAAEYRKLAEKRAVILRVPKPPPPDSDT
jgi:hypothetical protein